jgi:uncharacterized protein
MPELDLPEKHLQQLQTILQAHVPGYEVWAYGSRVSGGAHEGSDLDLILRHPHDLKQACEGLADLRAALQESRLPILVDVHDWAHLPAAFHAQISAAHFVIQFSA